jgi:hypothetical protein
MPNTQPTHSEVQFRAALGRIRDMAESILAEADTFLSANNATDTDHSPPVTDAEACPSTPDPSPVPDSPEEDLKAFRDYLRESHQDWARFDFCGMEYMVREARQVLQRVGELGADWSDTTRQLFADQLRQAKVEADKLVVRIIQVGLDDFLNRAKDQLADLKKHPDRLSPSDARAIREESENLDREWDEEIDVLCADQLRATRQEALAIANELETAAHLNNIEAALHGRIANVLSAECIQEEMEEAADFFRQARNLTPELQQQIRQGQERGARYRASKKLSQAQVAEAAGRSRVTERLKKEASALLAQDWALFFPGETPPPIV